MPYYGNRQIVIFNDRRHQLHLLGDTSINKSCHNYQLNNSIFNIFNTALTIAHYCGIIAKPILSCPHPLLFIRWQPVPITDIPIYR